MMLHLFSANSKTERADASTGRFPCMPSQAPARRPLSQAPASTEHLPRLLQPLLLGHCSEPGTSARNETLQAGWLLSMTRSASRLAPRRSGQRDRACATAQRLRCRRWLAALDGRCGARGSGFGDGDGGGATDSGGRAQGPSCRSPTSDGRR